MEKDHKKEQRKTFTRVVKNPQHKKVAHRFGGGKKEKHGPRRDEQKRKKKIRGSWTTGEDFEQKREMRNRGADQWFFTKT